MGIKRWPLSIRSNRGTTYIESNTPPPPEPEPTQYDYGWPAGGTEEPNVVAQWTFEETSGNIVDTVKGVELELTGSPNMNFGLSPTLFPEFFNISKGILYNETAYHMLAGANTDFDINTTNFVFEWIMYDTQTYNGTTVFDVTDAGTGRGYRFGTMGGSRQTFFYGRAEDDTTVSVSVNWGSTTNVPLDIRLKPVKFRLAGNWSTNLISVYVNSVLTGTINISTLNGKDLKCYNLVVADEISHNNFKSLYGALNELRITIGNDTNDSGGPEGVTLA
jgi:hypothetical protein